LPPVVGMGKGGKRTEGGGKPFTVGAFEGCSEFQLSCGSAQLSMDSHRLLKVEVVQQGCE